MLPRRRTTRRRRRQSRALANATDWVNTAAPPLREQHPKRGVTDTMDTFFDLSWCGTSALLRPTQREGPVRPEDGGQPGAPWTSTSAGSRQQMSALITPGSSRRVPDLGMLTVPEPFRTVSTRAASAWAARRCTKSIGTRRGPGQRRALRAERNPL